MAVSDHALEPSPARSQNESVGVAGPGLEPTLSGAFSSAGIDLTLIRWMLKRSPTERLEAAQDLINMVESSRRLDAD